MLRLRGTGGKALTRVGMVKGPSETWCGAGPMLRCWLSPGGPSSTISWGQGSAR